MSVHPRICQLEAENRGLLVEIMRLEKELKAAREEAAKWEAACRERTENWRDACRVADERRLKILKLEGGK